MNTESELGGDVGASEVTESDADMDREASGGLKKGKYKRIFLSQKGARKGKCNKIIWNEVNICSCIVYE